MEKRVQTNNDNFFISGSQKETPTRPGFFNFLGLQNKRNKEVQPQPQPQPIPQPQPQEEEATQLIHETSNVLNRVQNMNQTIAQINNQNQNKSKSKSSRESTELQRKSSNIGELKEVIQKLYDVVYKIYRIQLLTNNQKTRLLNVIQRNLNKNKDFLQVMNRIIEENNKVKEPTSNRENNTVAPPTNSTNNTVSPPTNNTSAPPTNSTVNRRNNGSSSLNNLFRNINSIPTNRNRNQTAVEPEPTAELAEEEPEPEVPNLVLSNRKISEIIKEENEESNVRLSNLLRNKNKNKNVNANKNKSINGANVPANNSGVLVENVVNSETKSREKRINRSRKLMTLLSTINPISLNVAKQKLQNYQK